MTIHREHKADLLTQDDPEQAWRGEFSDLLNTPAQVIGDNLDFIGEAVGMLAELLSAHDDLIDEMRARGLMPPWYAEVQRCRAEYDPDYLFRQLPLAVEEAHQALERFSTGVGFLRAIAKTQSGGHSHHGHGQGKARPG